MKKVKAFCCIAVLLMTVLGMAACSKTESENAVVDYCIVSCEEVPTQLVHLIDENKLKDFHLTYSDEGCLYIVRGYGKQDTNGYSISVEELTKEGDVLVLNTTLIGPAPGEAVGSRQSFPYIILKTEDIGCSVIFE